MTCTQLASVCNIGLTCLICDTFYSHSTYHDMNKKALWILSNGNGCINGFSGDQIPFFIKPIIVVVLNLTVKDVIDTNLSTVRLQKSNA